MDLDSAALLNADPMIVTRVEDKSQDASNSATAPATSLADPSLPSFRDMVVGRNSAVDGVDQQGPMTIPTHGNSGTGNISHLHVVSNGLSTSGLQVLVLAHTNANSNGAAVGGVEPSAPGEMEIVAPMEGLNRENEQVMESTVPSCISHVEGNVVDYVLLSEPDAVETVVVPTVAAKGKVVAAPTSLPSGKHMVVQVIDESSKRVLQKHNGKAMYGRIRSTTAKGVKQNSNVAKPVARKDT
ncbi:hypothetical protein V6N11_054233 [Hibiscus sabdariffa]|uniref:Uncharacterized protein n=1 Tax=Hibiscus sabdariffa TaxID=183260 RepID=A0ABR2S3G1_9ROSI